MKTSSSKLSRRNFLIGASAGGVAAAVAVASSKSPQAQPKKTGAVSGSKGYHVTEHIRKYYSTTKV
jgi:acetyl esterase/lipase